MAITWELSLESIKSAGEQFAGKLLTGSVTMVLKDDGVEVSTQTFSAPYKDVDGLTDMQQLNKFAMLIGGQMQTAINNYKRESALKENALVATTLTAIHNGLEG